MIVIIQLLKFPKPCIGNRGQCDGTACSQLCMGYNSLRHKHKSVHFYEKAVQLIRSSRELAGQKNKVYITAALVASTKRRVKK